MRVCVCVCSSMTALWLCIIQLLQVKRINTLFCNYYLFRLANPVKRECHHMCAVENVPVPTATGDWSYLAAVEADGHLMGDLWLWRCGGFSYCATEVKPCEDTRKKVKEESFCWLHPLLEWLQNKTGFLAVPNGNKHFQLLCFSLYLDLVCGLPSRREA